LERTFFHDILNTAGGLQGYTELMQMCSAEQIVELELERVLPQLASQLVEEIQTQRLLVQAERNQVELCVEELAPSILLRQQVDGYGHHEVARWRTLEVVPNPSPATIYSDRALVQRVLGNMTKNALEACPESGRVTLAWREHDGGVAFDVHNPTAMPKEVQLQVFKRSFSTKGVGRGIGTYSMKLFGESYLGGRVEFASAADTGTTFTFWLPTHAAKSLIQRP
jgi:signal transduction histidine kinase